MYHKMLKLCQKVTHFARINHQSQKQMSIKRRLTNTDIVFNTLTDENKNKLSTDLHMKIKAGGPISVANYMKTVLTHPTKGYYTTRDVFGQEGDFTTSPEISQLFGEIIAVWSISEYSKMYNKKFNLVELGPGRGTLLKDILRVFKQLNMTDKVTCHLVEVSPFLAEVQKQTLSSGNYFLSEDSKFYQSAMTEDDVEVFWYKSILDLPQGFTIFIANEFFDALPIHKFIRNEQGWFEMLIDIDPAYPNEEKFRFVLSKTPISQILIDPNEKRDHIEISFDAVNIIRYISAAITQNGGFSLIIDYGHNGNKTDTFRAFRGHKQVDPLSEPGTADLTADVDFSLLKKAAQETRPVLCYGPVDQADFLNELNINVRLANLCNRATKEQREQLESGYKKIMSKDEMGTCFKVMSMFPQVLKEHLEKFPVEGFYTNSSQK